MRRALIDTSAIYAMTVKADPNHARAVAFGARWLSERNTFILPDWVFIETMLLIKGRFGTAPAVRVGQEIRRNPMYQWMAVSPDDEREVWASFQKYDDKEWSYIDCALLVLSNRLRITEVFAFDSHFDQMPGVKRLPS